MATIQIPTGPRIVGRDQRDHRDQRSSGSHPGRPPAEAPAAADAPRTGSDRSGADLLTDAELVAQAEARSERLRTWLPTVVSVAALLAMAAVAAYAARTVVGFGVYLVGLVG